MSKGEERELLKLIRQLQLDIERGVSRSTLLVEMERLRKAAQAEMVVTSMQFTQPVVTFGTVGSYGTMSGPTSTVPVDDLSYTLHVRVGSHTYLFHGNGPVTSVPDSKDKNQ